MSKKPHIKIEKVKRVCSFNDDVAAGKTKSHFIYDFNVLIDGEYRAQFRPGLYNGYNLNDPDRFSIKGATDHGRWDRKSDVASQAEFQSKIESCLERGLIPTIAQLEAARLARQQKADAEDAARAEANRIYQIKETGLEMLAELKHLYEKHGYQSTADVIAKAEGR